MADPKQGKRVDWWDGLPVAGEYAKHPDGQWHGCTPTGLFANLSGHSVTEHEDGTITVSPSILVHSHSDGEWHGYLERGVWREC